MSWTSLASGRADAFIADRAGRAPMNEAAFLDLYARTAGPLNGYLCRLTGNAAVAEDLVQEAYLRFLSQPRVPEDHDHRRNYLYRIATNLARDHFRQGRRHQVLPDADARPSIDPALSAEPTTAFDVDAVLSRLSPRDRELLLLAYVEGLTHQEIGHITGLMRGSIKPLLFRARRRFARAWQATGLPAADAAGVMS
jgi:RNA polymerase sigma-70 factor (ECF subfamily)